MDELLQWISDLYKQQLDENLRESDKGTKTYITSR